MTAVDDYILQIVGIHKSGKPIGITSICSANQYVLKAAILNARKNDRPLLIESTSNQVDQFGGYTGLTPAQFKHSVQEIAARLDYPAGNIIFGGDHLGPNRWQAELSDSAMIKAGDQIKVYVSAGFTKIHLDASMKCADDGSHSKPLDPSVIAERSALLCKASEEAISGMPNQTTRPVYIIGTDVPPPGGAKENHNSMHITKPAEVRETISLTKGAFKKHDLDEAWERVIGVVVQPGVEFGDTDVNNYDRNAAGGLVQLIGDYPGVVYEAHSTDYQKRESLRQMVEDHFVFLKVGPWLTFKFREAVFALELIEQELLSHKKGTVLSKIGEVIEQVMIQSPKHWEKYYCSEENENKLKRKYSYSDRIRYYWPEAAADNSIKKLIRNLSVNRIPETLLSQYFPEEYYAVREGLITENPEDIILHRISSVLEIYNYATSGGSN